MNRKVEAPVTRLDETKFIEKFGTWWPYLKPGFDRGMLDEVFSYLKKRAAMGIKIAPESTSTFKAFTATPYAETKVVIVGMSPYHSINKQGKIVADGLALSCSNNELGDIQPSLDQFYKALEVDVYNGLKLDYIENTDLSYLSSQGVLLINASLTTEIGTAGVHHSLWNPFSDYLFREVISYMEIPVVFLGEKAQEYMRLLAPWQDQFALSHPASVCYRKPFVQWSSEGVFSKVDAILARKDQKINWLEELPF